MDEVKKISPGLAVAGCVTAAMFWGGMYVVAKDALNVISANYMLSIRFGIAFLIMLVVYFKYVKKVNKEALKGCVITGTFMAAGYASLTMGLQYINAGNSAFITDTYVIWIPFIVYLIWKIKPEGPHVYIAAVMTLIGISLLTLQGGLQLQFGDAITLFGSFCWAGELITIDIYAKKIQPQLLVTFQTLTVAILTFLFANIAGEPVPTMAVLTEPKLIMQFAFLILLSTFLANSLQNYCQRFITATQASVIFPMESVFAAAFGMLFLKEVYNGLSVLGMVLLFSAILMSNLGGRLFRKKGEPVLEAEIESKE